MDPGNKNQKRKGLSERSATSTNARDKVYLGERKKKTTPQLKSRVLL